MDVAPLVAEVLARQQVKVTFFAANERTKVGDGSLGDHWAPWWKARAAEGHEFALAHLGPRVLARATSPASRRAFACGRRPGRRKARSRPGPRAQYCDEVARAASRLQAITGKTPLPLFRAPGGKTSPRLLAAARGLRLGARGLVAGRLPG